MTPLLDLARLRPHWNSTWIIARSPSPIQRRSATLLAPDATLPQHLRCYG